MQKKPLLILPVEVYKREFLGKLLLGVQAVERGFQVIIGEHSDPLFARLPPGAVLYKDHAQSSRMRLLHWKNQGHVVTALDEEGIIYISEDQYREARVAQGADGMLDMVFLWGENQRKLLSPFLPPEKLCLAGNPRFDLVHLLRRNAAHGQQTVRVLINTRFPSCNGYRDSEVELQSYRALGLLRNAADVAAYRHRVSEDRKILAAFLELIDVLGHRTDVTVSVRPHPAEKASTYQSHAARYGNIVVDGDADLLEQIASHDMVIHDGCTTAIEAHAMGKVVLGLRPADVDLDYGDLPNSFSRNFATVADLVAYAFSQDKEAFKPALDPAASIFNWHRPVSCDAILSALERFPIRPVALQDLARSDWRGSAHAILKRSRPLRLALLTMFGDRGRRFIERQDVIAHKFPALSQTGVEQMVQRLQTHRGSSHPIGTRMLNQRCLVLHSSAPATRG